MLKGEGYSNFIFFPSGTLRRNFFSNFEIFLSNISAQNHFLGQFSAFDFHLQYCAVPTMVHFGHTTVWMGPSPSSVTRVGGLNPTCPRPNPVPGCQNLTSLPKSFLQRSTLMWKLFSDPETPSGFLYALCMLWETGCTGYLGCLSNS